MPMLNETALKPNMTKSTESCCHLARVTPQHVGLNEGLFVRELVREERDSRHRFSIPDKMVQLKHAEFISSSTQAVPQQELAQPQTPSHPNPEP